MSTVTLLFHVSVAGYFMVVAHWMKENMLQNVQKDDKEIHDATMKVVKRFSLRYLTNWTFTLQTIYLYVALGEDIIGLFKGREKLKDKINKFKNYYFTVLVAPMALVVTTVFWGIWHVDRNLIFPPEMDKYLPPWINHSLHTITSVVVLLEVLLCSHKYPAFKPALLGITGYLLVYAVCLMLTYYQSGIWLYPVLKTLSWPLRISFCLAIYALAIALYGVGYFVNKIFWNQNIDTKKAPKKKHKKH